MNDSLDEIVREVVSRYLELDTSEVDLDQHLDRDLGLDPLDLVLIALRLEEIESVVFPMERLGTAVTVQDLASILEGVRITWSYDMRAVAS